MHMVIKNTLYPSILSPTIPYPYLFCVGEGEEASTSACFPPPSRNALSYKAEITMTLKIHLEFVRICVS